MDIVKAIVESVVDMHHIKIRIPSLDRTTATNVHTGSDVLYTATFCVMPKCTPNVRPGDIVFVGFERAEYRKAVVLGVLYREAYTESICDMIINDLKVNGKCTLPRTTSIGNVSQYEIERLSGLNDNIQSQFNSLRDRINALEDEVALLMNKNST